MSSKPIVIAVDGSPAAQRAAEVGLDLAAALGARVIFVHGSERITRQLFQENPSKKESLQQRLGADVVLREAANLATEKGVKAEFEVWGGQGVDDLAPGLAGLADAVDSQLIVVGSRGHGSLAGMILGSVSRALLALTELPVLVVKQRSPSP